MHNILHTSPSAHAVPSPADVRDRLRWRFTTGQQVIQAGDSRQVYRVESGAVCHFSGRADGRFSVFEFAFAGDLVGLGYLPTHSSTAVAMVDTTVALVSPAELELAVLTDDRVSYMLADAGERDFDYLRAKTVEAAPHAPEQRLANYLLAVLGVTRGERGVGALLIPDDIASGYVAELLGMSVNTMAMALLSLRRSGAVDVSPSGLRVLHVGRLEMVAGAT